MKLFSISIGIGLAVVFAISNHLSYVRGEDSGYKEGYLDGVHAEIQKDGAHSYKVTIRHKEE